MSRKFAGLLGFEPRRELLESSMIPFHHRPRQPYFIRERGVGNWLLQLTDFLVGGVFPTSSAVLGQRELLGGLGLVPLGDVVEVATNGAFQA